MKESQSSASSEVSTMWTLANAVGVRYRNRAFGSRKPQSTIGRARHGIMWQSHIRKYVLYTDIRSSLWITHRKIKTSRPITVARSDPHLNTESLFSLRHPNNTSDIIRVVHANFEVRRSSVLGFFLYIIVIGSLSSLCIFKSKITFLVLTSSERLSRISRFTFSSNIIYILPYELGVLIFQCYFYRKICIHIQYKPVSYLWCKHEIDAKN